MVAAASIGVSVKTLFIILYCLIIAAFVYLFIFGDYRSCFDVHSRWFVLIAADFTTYVAVIGPWVAYKESSWVIATVLMVTMYFLGSLVSIAYILTQFYKLSHEESLKDPLYFVLARRQKRDIVCGGPSVVATRVIFSLIGCVELGATIYTLIVELSPTYPKYFTSCYITTEIDMYIHLVIISLWILYKESTWRSSFLWIVLLVCFTGITICAYVLRQLSELSSQQPAFLIIFNNKNRDLQSSDPLLMAHPNDGQLV